MDRLERVFAVRAHATEHQQPARFELLVGRHSEYETRPVRGQREIWSAGGDYSRTPLFQIQIGREAAGQGNLVGEAGFEPATPWPPAKCAAGLRYSPNQGSILTISD